jgi:hypothetical protein
MSMQHASPRTYGLPVCVHTRFTSFIAGRNDGQPAMVCNRVTDSVGGPPGGPAGGGHLDVGPGLDEVACRELPVVRGRPQRLADHRSAHPIAFGQGSLGSFTPIGSPPLSIAENRSSNTDPRRSAASSPRQACAPSPSVARYGLGGAPRKSDKPSGRTASGNKLRRPAVDHFDS